jgi:hypothetical protein
MEVLAMDERSERFVKIATLENLMEAQILEDVLGERNIPFRIRSFHDTAYDGLFQLQKGWGEVYAPAGHEMEIKGVIEGIRADTASR